MKWQWVEFNKGQINYGDGDKLVKIAQQNNMKVRGHTLVWHNQLPFFVNSIPKADFNKTMQKHIEDEVTHYKGSIYAWDVVNEPFNEDGTFRESVFYQNLGESYIADALRFAHKADPDAKLYINDYNVEGINKKSDALYKLVSQLKKDGIPIHGVGLQSHFILWQVPTDLEKNMKRFSDLGLDVAITELDIRLNASYGHEPPSHTWTTEELKGQADQYAKVVKGCLAVPRCVGITIWGLTGSSQPWHDDYQPKPALAAIEAALKG